MHLVWQWLITLWNVPNGSMWSNLFASPVTWAIVAIGSGRIVKVLHKHHEEKLAQAEAHHSAHMEKLEAIHEDVKSLPPS